MASQSTTRRRTFIIAVFASSSLCTASANLKRADDSSMRDARGADFLLLDVASSLKESYAPRASKAESKFCIFRTCVRRDKPARACGGGGMFSSSSFRDMSSTSSVVCKARIIKTLSVLLGLCKDDDYDRLSRE